MADKKNTHLVDECKRLEEDSSYNAVTHFEIANSNSRVSLWLKFIPASVGVVSGALLLNDYPLWLAWLAVISGIVSALSTILDPDKGTNDHLFAAREFTVLKHDARSCYQTFALEMSDTEFVNAVQGLRHRYNDMVRYTPPTSDTAFEKARKKIKDGLYTTDFISESKK